MQNIMLYGTWIVENYQSVLSGIDAILAGLIAICILIPGPEPERTLRKFADFLAKFSAKKEKND